MSAFTRFLESGVIFEEGITLRQFYILDIINKKNKIELSDIHSILKVDKSTTTRLLSPLLKNGFISKVKSTENHRTFSLSLTEKGNIIHKSTSDCISEFLSEVISEFSIDGDDFFRLTEMVSEVVEKKYCCKK
jgi:DNA-binding MarR family transcriptional regulator